MYGFAKYQTQLVETPGTGLFDRNGVERKPNKGDASYVCGQSCSRCGGYGGADKWKPTGWKCYRCGGSGQDPNNLVLPLYTAEKLAKLNATRDKIRAKKAAKAEAAAEAKRVADEAARVARADMLAADPLFALLTKYAPRNEFVADMLGKLRVRDLSDAQVSAAQAACERIAKQDAEAATSSHLGNVGDRVKIDAVVTVSRCIYQADPSGWRGGRPDANRYLIKMKDTAGNVLVWFTASGWKEGAHMVGTATVKAHDEYKGVKQTTVKNFRAAKRPAETENDE